MNDMKSVKNIDKVWKQDTLKREILSWWRQFRPVGWNILAHIENPTINTGNDWNRRMAKIAAKIARANFNRRNKKIKAKIAKYKLRKDVK